jgi:hypothetical protein
VSQTKGVAHFRRPSAAAPRCTFPPPFTSLAGAARTGEEVDDRRCLDRHNPLRFGGPVVIAQVTQLATLAERPRAAADGPTVL